MNLYCFNIKASPLPDNPQGKDIGGANAIIWVFDTSIESAKIKAFNFINEYG